MNEPRTNVICIYVGARSTGKTSYAKNLIDDFPQPKTLIVDILDNPVWHTLETYNHPEWINRTIPIMPLNKIRLHKSGIYRMFSNDIDELEDLLVDYVRNTAVLVEDCSRWYESKLTKKQKKYLLNTKQTNCDMHLFFHVLADVPPQLVKYADYLTIFKTGEKYYDKKKYFHPGFDRAFNTVFESKDKHIHRTIRLQ